MGDVTAVDKIEVPGVRSKPPQPNELKSPVVSVGAELSPLERALWQIQWVWPDFAEWFRKLYPDVPPGDLELEFELGTMAALENAIRLSALKDRKFDGAWVDWGSGDGRLAAALFKHRARVLAQDLFMVDSLRDKPDPGIAKVLPNINIRYSQKDILTMQEGDFAKMAPIGAMSMIRLGNYDALNKILKMAPAHLSSKAPLMIMDDEAELKDLIRDLDARKFPEFSEYARDLNHHVVLLCKK